jgi:hypothetical protein
MAVITEINTPSNFPSELAMGEPAAKRAKIEVASLQQLDLNNFSLKLGTKTAKGQAVYPTIGGEPIRVNLTPDTWAYTSFGFDYSGRYEQPSFLGGKAPEKAGMPEGLKIQINLENEQADFLQKLDDAARKAFAEINPSCKWNPLVRYDQRMSTKVNVILKGGDLTKLAVVKDNDVRRGQGFEFLKDFDTTFSRAEVKIALRVKSLYCVAGNAGLRLEATQLVLRCVGKPEEVDLFGDDNDLLA